MSKHNEITDEEFVPFLHSLGVETYKKSFEWMLSDPCFSGVFTWLYNNLDHNNALTAREEYRYTELKKSNQLLSSEDLETTISTIQQDFPRICLPGDQHAIEDVKLDIKFQKEKLYALQKQEKVMNNLINQNEKKKEQLAIEITKLNAAQQQYCDDESSAAAECLALAEEVETLTEGVVDIIADSLDVYTNCHVDKDISKRFVSFGPLEPYRQSQALFRSHFDLYTDRKFTKKHNDSCTDEDLRTALVEAKGLEERLSVAALAYIESKADLSGEQAKLELATNYSNVHPSQMTTFALEAQSAIELLQQEDAILDQQLRSAVKQLVTSRSQLATAAVTRAAIAVREQIHSDLAHLLDVSSQALAIDKLLYCALREELRAVQAVAQFAAQLKEYVHSETLAVASRIESMSEITSAQEAATLNLINSDILLHTLAAILSCQPTDDVTLLAKLSADMRTKVKELREDVKEGYRRKEEAIRLFASGMFAEARVDDFYAMIRKKTASLLHRTRNSHNSILKMFSALSPLRAYIYDGCTRQPNCYDRTVISLTHSLRQQLESVERTVLDLGGRFTSVKNGDKRNMRKLWQWFLTDPPRLLAAVSGIQATYT